MIGDAAHSTRVYVCVEAGWGGWDGLRLGEHSADRPLSVYLSKPDGGGDTAGSKGVCAS